MDAVPQLASLAPVAAGGATDATGSASEQATGAVFQLPAAAADPAAAETTAGTRSARRVQRGETLPDGGNLLPLVVGLLPPVTSLAAAAAPADAAAAGGTPAQVTPPALASFAQTARPAPERGAKPAPSPRPSTSTFDHLLASHLPAEVRAALAAALKAASSTPGGADAAATPAPQAATLPAARVPAAAADAAALALLTPSSGDAAADGLPIAVADQVPSARAAPSAAVATAPTGATLAERRGTTPLPSTAAPIAREPTPAAVVVDTSLQVEHGPDIAAAADAPPPAFTHLQPGAPRAAEGATVMTVATPVGSPTWSDAVGDRVAWLVQQDLGQAHLKLNPPQLGPVEVRVQINGDQAAVSFTAHNQQTRDALADASQRLRDLLGAQGFVNVQVDVGQQPFQERPMLFAPYEDDAAPATGGGGARATTAMPVVRGARALLDAYA